MTTTQEQSLTEIQDHITIIEHIKTDLKKRYHEATSRIQKQYIEEKMRQYNTELRVLTRIEASFRRTIREYENRLKKTRSER
jgi:hypothetical protein